MTSTNSAAKVLFPLPPLPVKAIFICMKIRMAEPWGKYRHTSERVRMAVANVPTKRQGIPMPQADLREVALMGFGHRDEDSFDGVMRLGFCVELVTGRSARCRRLCLHP